MPSARFWQRSLNEPARTKPVNRSSSTGRRPLLGIALPTYNRADCLKLTLDVLCREAASLEEPVSLLVCDNASPDATPGVIATAQSAFPALRTVRHPANIGGVANILRGIELVEADWIWILPDDCLPEPGALRNLSLRLKAAHPPLLYARCALWPEGELDLRKEVPVKTLFGTYGEILYHLSWLPCLVLHRDSVLRHIPQGYRLGYSYPHLVLALLALREAKADAMIMVEPRVFRTQEAVSQTKRYTWIHGALWHFAQTVRAFLPVSDACAILRRCARTERLGSQALACMPAEFSVLPPMTPWSLVRHYGAAMIPALLAFLWLRYVPRPINRTFLVVACIATARGPLSRLNAPLRRIGARLLPGRASLETDF